MSLISIQRVMRDILLQKQQESRPKHSMPLSAIHHPACPHVFLPLLTPQVFFGNTAWDVLYTWAAVLNSLNILVFCIIITADTVSFYEFVLCQWWGKISCAHTILGLSEVAAAFPDFLLGVIYPLLFKVMDLIFLQINFNKSLVWAAVAEWD